MKSMERFGEALVSYEGVASVGVPHPEGVLEIQGYFEAAQFSSGRLVVSVVPTNVPKPERVTLTPDRDEGISFDGHDLDGWVLKPRGETSFSSLSWHMALLQPLRERTLSAQYFEAKRANASEHGYNEATFLVSNLLMGR